MDYFFVVQATFCNRFSNYTCAMLNIGSYLSKHLIAKISRNVFYFFRMLLVAIEIEIASGSKMADLSTSENKEIYQTQQLPNSNQATIINSPMQYDVEIFINLIKEEPCLWNTSSRGYKEQNKKRNAW